MRMRIEAEGPGGIHVVGARRRLPGLPAVVPGLRRRRRRRPERHGLPAGLTSNGWAWTPSGSHPSTLRPMADFGYDITDYTDIDPIFGTLDDFDRLVAEAHRRGIKVILDFVPNHTSDEHPWFVESRASRDDPKRDWYIWRDPNRRLPAQQLAAPSAAAPGSWDEATRQYYYHAFLQEQPDLNWRNPAVREAMYDVLRFWLDRGSGWVPGRRLLAADEGRALPRQPGEPRLNAGDRPYDAQLSCLLHRPAGGTRGRPRDARRARRVRATGS